MAERVEEEEIAPRGNDWEVISLTASAYAAAPGPVPVAVSVGDKGSVYAEGEVETSDVMFMSRHFLLPENETKDVPAGSELEDSISPKEEMVEDLAPFQVRDESVGSVDKDEGVKSFAITENDLGAQVFEVKESAIATVQMITVQPVGNVKDLEESIHPSAEQASATGASHSDVKTVLSKSTDPSMEAVDDGPADVTSSRKAKDKKKARSSDPCGPWWKRQAASLYDHVKEANPLWSIVIAAAVVGLAVLGKRWHQRKPHTSLLNLQFSAKEEKSGKILGPVTQLKEAFVSGNHGSSFARSHVSSEV